jgi:hypothetical protein
MGAVINSESTCVLAEIANLDAIAGFVLLTLASVGLLALLPAICRKHVVMVGTYAHEVSHGLVCLITGGSFHQFQVDEIGGMCITSGGNRMVVAAAGYTGTIVLGATLIARSAQQDAYAVALQVLAVLVALSTLKAGDVRTAVVGAVLAALLGLFGTLLPGTLATRLLLNLVGVILVWQGFKAWKTLCRVSAQGQATGSDAEAMAYMTGRSALQLTVIIGGIAGVALLVILGMAVRTGTVAP